MALELGVNCGFVLTAPTSDPLETAVQFSTRSYAMKVVAPAGRIVAMGWWCDTVSEEANFQLGVHAHDSVNDKPDALLASSGDIAKGTTAGYKLGDVLYDMDEDSTLWLALQVDQTATLTRGNYLATISDKTDYKATQTSLTDPWGTSTSTFARIIAVFAVYEPATGGQPIAKRWGGIPYSAIGARGRW